MKQHFSIFNAQPGLTYLDSAATALKPKRVIDAISDYYTNYSSNIHRGLYPIAEKASEKYEEARQVVADFIRADLDEVVFTHGATESVNLLAYGFGREALEKDDEIVTTIMEHHANFVPWQQLAFELGLDLKIVDIDEHLRLALYDKEGHMDLDPVITKRTKLFCVSMASNVLGGANPVKEIIAQARRINPNIVVVVDAAQSVVHMPIDVKDLDCDFLVFSGHKLYGPTGIGVLYGKKDLLNSMFPFLFGGDMVEDVEVNKTIFKEAPYRFEAGTPHIAGAIGLAEAIEFFKEYANESHARVAGLFTTLITTLQTQFKDDITLYFQTPQHTKLVVPLVVFTFKNVHAHDVAQILAQQNIAVRAGHHCAMPLQKRLGLTATARISLSMYSDMGDIERLVEGLNVVKKTFV